MQRKPKPLFQPRKETYKYDCIATGRHPEGDHWSKKIAIKKGKDKPTFWEGLYNCYFCVNFNANDLFNVLVDSANVTHKVGKSYGPVKPGILSFAVSDDSDAYFQTIPFITIQNDYFNLDIKFINKKFSPDRPYESLILNIHIKNDNGDNHTDFTRLDEIDLPILSHIVSDKLNEFREMLNKGMVEHELNKIVRVSHHFNDIGVNYMIPHVAEDTKVAEIQNRTNRLTNSDAADSKAPNELPSHGLK